MSSPVTIAPQPRASRSTPSSASKCGRIVRTCSEAWRCLSGGRFWNMAPEVSDETKSSKNCSVDSAAVSCSSACSAARTFAASATTSMYSRGTFCSHTLSS